MNKSASLRYEFKTAEDLKKVNLEKIFAEVLGRNDKLADDEQATLDISIRIYKSGGNGKLIDSL